MATRAKDQQGPGKEKRGTSPSYPRHTNTTPQSKRSPTSTPCPSRPPDQKHAPSTATPFEKRIPNYLKPTVSSAPNPTVQGKTSSNNTAQKHTLNRRRSFDKPPSPNSHLLKSHTMVNPTGRTITRSSSHIVPRVNSSLPKPEERLSKAYRDAGKSHSLVSGNKKMTAVKKQNDDATISAATVSTKAPDISLPELITDTSPPVECHQEDQESSVTGVEEESEIKAEESNSELVSHVSVLEEGQKEDIKADTGGSSPVRAAEPEKNQNQEITTIESSNALENQNESLDVHMEEAEDEEKFVEETRKAESQESHEEERAHDDDKEGEENATENSIDKSLDKEVGEESQTEYKEREEVEEIVTETKTEMENTGGEEQQQQQQRQGKKETQPYNDVIEETASKLREERKNKVKALVGAFETVISLQEPEA